MKAKEHLCDRHIPWGYVEGESVINLRICMIPGDCVQGNKGVQLLTKNLSVELVPDSLRLGREGQGHLP